MTSIRGNSPPSLPTDLFKTPPKTLLPHESVPQSLTTPSPDVDSQKNTCCLSRRSFRVESREDRK